MRGKWPDELNLEANKHFHRNPSKEIWSSSTLATSCKKLTHWKRLWCWEGLGAGGEGDDRGWDGWMASLTRWTWVWVNSGIWWWTGRPGVLRFMESQRVGHDWATELNWMFSEVEHIFMCLLVIYVSLEKYLLESFAYFWIGLLVFYCGVLGVLYLSWILTLIRYMIYK